jgi:CTP:molybdopterin cytidylyltransferase MocA
VIPAVVLAAGASSRFAASSQLGAKQRLLLPAVLERVHASPVDGVVVVLGAHDVETDARVVRCPEWRVGPGGSLRCGLAALPGEAEAAAIVLADGPDLAPAAVARLIEAWRSGAGELYAATYGGLRSHPVVIGRALWGSVPDEGFRAMAAELVPCDDLGPPGDVDYAEDLPGRFRPSKDSF